VSQRISQSKDEINVKNSMDYSMGSSNFVNDSIAN
jgi:hypothetical protein